MLLIGLGRIQLVTGTVNIDTHQCQEYADISLSEVDIKLGVIPGEVAQILRLKSTGVRCMMDVIGVVTVT